MLQNGSRLILLNTFGHHVKNIVHHSSSQLQVIMTLYPLFGDSLCHSLRMASLELPGKEVTQPPLKQWNDSTQEEKPDSPAGSPESTTRTFTNRTLERIIQNEENINKIIKLYYMIIKLSQVTNFRIYI